LDLRESSPASSDAQSKEYPEDSRLNSGVVFPVEWDNLWLNGKKLRPDQLGFRVKHLSQLRGSRSISRVWRHGADLQYVEEDGSKVKLWLCKYCHGQGLRAATKAVNGYNYIVHHLQKEHRIDVTGTAELKPDNQRLLLDPWDATRETIELAGSGRGNSHTPWQEGALQAALVDWVISQDQSFLKASSAETRGIIS
jgi:hypothetical protein